MQTTLIRAMVRVWRFEIKRLLLLGLSYSLVSSSPAVAQIIPDRSLPSNSLVTNQGNITVITGGTTSGTNLFHSFSQFSLSTGNTALFNNATNIQNIFARVTGGSVSNIDGTLTDNGTANLWLINPNGIIFGQNATLNIGGSFFATTASSINFADGFKFNADASQSSPLLSINIPIGLQFNGNPGSISLQGSGQGVIEPTEFLKTYSVNSSGGLSVPTGKSISLVGGNINFQGASVNAPGGLINIGSVSSGNVTLHSIPQGWDLSYENTLAFGNINLNQQTLIDTIGNGGGSINLQGNNISASGGSAVFINNTGNINSGSINVNSSTLQLSGSAADTFNSIFSTQGLENGATGDINIRTQQLILAEGATLYTLIFNNSSGGNININTNSLQILGFFPPIPTLPSAIVSINYGSNQSGNITIFAKQILAQDGGEINSITSTSDNGNGGNIFINASDIQLINPDLSLTAIENNKVTNSYIGSTTNGSTGNAGNIIINAPTIYLQNSGEVFSQTEGNGSAGKITINSSLIQLTANSLIDAAALTSPPLAQELFNSPPIPSGNPGTVDINTDNLILTNNAQISITNQGTSTAGGIININANSATLNNSKIVGTTSSGVGGNINLNVTNLQLLDNSNITATANNNGNGGNIKINTKTLVGLNNSNITANAFAGNGGNVEINTEGLFFSPDSLITASSDKGISGTVTIHDPQVVNLTTKSPSNKYLNISKPGPLCQLGVIKQNELVILRKGGTPQNPNFPLIATLGWKDSTPISHTGYLPNNPPDETNIKEAQGWKINSDGTVSFSDQTQDPSLYGSLEEPTCQFSLSKY